MPGLGREFQVLGYGLTLEGDAQQGQAQKCKGQDRESGNARGHACAPSASAFRRASHAVFTFSVTAAMVPTICDLCKGLHDLPRFRLGDAIDVNTQEDRSRLIRKPAERGEDVTKKDMKLFRWYLKVQLVSHRFVCQLSLKRGEPMGAHPEDELHLHCCGGQVTGLQGCPCLDQQVHLLEIT